MYVLHAKLVLGPFSTSQAIEIPELEDESDVPGVVVVSRKVVAIPLESPGSDVADEVVSLSVVEEEEPGVVEPRPEELWVSSSLTVDVESVSSVGREFGEKQPATRRATLQPSVLSLNPATGGEDSSPVVALVPCWLYPTCPRVATMGGSDTWRTMSEAVARLGSPGVGF